MAWGTEHSTTVRLSVRQGEGDRQARRCYCDAALWYGMPKVPTFLCTHSRLWVRCMTHSLATPPGPTCSHHSTLTPAPAIHTHTCRCRVLGCMGPWAMAPCTPRAWRSTAAAPTRTPLPRTSQNKEGQPVSSHDGCTSQPSRQPLACRDGCHLPLCTHVPHSWTSPAPWASPGSHRMHAPARAGGWSEPAGRCITRHAGCDPQRIHGTHHTHHTWVL